MAVHVFIDKSHQGFGELKILGKIMLAQILGM